MAHSFRLPSLALSVFALTGCPVDPPASVDSGVDAYTARDAGPVDAAPLCSAAPTGNFGVSMGRSLPNFQLLRCDDSPFEIYDSFYCGSEHAVTVLSVAADWCGPCHAEASELGPRIADAYASRGVRVVQVVVQTTERSTPTASTCNGWQTNPRHNLGSTIVAYDPTGVIDPYVPSDSIPVTTVINNRGAVIYRERGYTAGLGPLRAAIEAELTRQGR